MKSTHRPNYGTLPLSPARTNQLQLDWEMVEPAAPVPRFLDFPRVAQPVPAPATSAKRHERRPLAA